MADAMVTRAQRRQKTKDSDSLITQDEAQTVSEMGAECIATDDPRLKGN